MVPEGIHSARDGFRGKREQVYHWLRGDRFRLFRLGIKYEHGGHFPHGSAGASCPAASPGTACTREIPALPDEPPGSVWRHLGILGISEHEGFQTTKSHRNTESMQKAL